MNEKNYHVFKGFLSDFFFLSDFRTTTKAEKKNVKEGNYQGRFGFIGHMVLKTKKQNKKGCM